MKIYGREIKFLRTVKATSDIANLCPDQDIERLGELFGGALPKTLETGAKIIHYLNEGYEMNQKFMNPEYEPKIISVEEILYLPDNLFTDLMKSAMEGIGNGAEQSIELEETKKKEDQEGLN